MRATRAAGLAESIGTCMQPALSAPIMLRMASGDLGIKMHTRSPFSAAAFTQQMRELIAPPLQFRVGETLVPKDDAARVGTRFGLSSYPVLQQLFHRATAREA